MSKKVYKFKAQVWLYPSLGGWHFVNVPKKIAKEIKKVGKPYGAGFVKVKVTLGKSTWVTALFPDTKSETYLLSVKKTIRKKEGVWENDKINLSFALEK